MADNGPARDRLRAAELVAMRLGRLLERLSEELLTLPRWRPAAKKRSRLLGEIDAGLEFWDAWRQEFKL